MTEEDYIRSVPGDEDTDGAEDADVRTRFGDGNGDDSFAKAVTRASVATKLFGSSTPVTLGRYVVRERVGTGAFGVVWGGWDPDLDRHVAIKVLQPAANISRSRVVAEGKALAKLSDPNVVSLFDVGVVGDEVYLVMEWVRGQTLRDYATPTRSVAEIVEVYRQAGAGLAAAHREGIVHCDFKPANAIRGTDGRVRVLDFGVATLAGNEEIGGTPRYRAPELTDNAPSFASDQFAFAVSLGEALHARGEVPTWLAAIVARGSAPVPTARFASMALLVAELARDRTLRRRRIAVMLGAAVIAGTSLTAWLVRPGAPSSDDAIYYAALGASLEANLRVEHMAPRHDLRPGVAKLHATIDELRAKADHGDGGGASRFALAKALELVDELDASREAYQRAWNDGFHQPSVRQGLGTVMARIYDRELRAARATLTGATLEARKQQLERELAIPAASYVTTASGDVPSRDAMNRALVALLDGDFAGARAAADEALRLDPDHYEAFVLKARAWQREAALLPPAKRGPLLAKAAESLETAVTWGRSDPEIALRRVEVRVWQYHAQAATGTDVEAARAILDGTIADAAALDPDDSELLFQRGEQLRFDAMRAHLTDASQMLAPLIDSAALLRRAVARKPDDVRILIQLEITLEFLAYRFIATSHEDNALAVLEEGTRVIAHAASLEPASAEIASRQSGLYSQRSGLDERLLAPTSEATRLAVVTAKRAVDIEANPRRTSTLVQKMLEEARWSWLAGTDPRAETKRATSLITPALRDAATNEAWLADQLAGAYDAAAAVDELTGMDPRTDIEHGLAIITAHTTKVERLDIVHAELLVHRARRELDDDHDPAATVDQIDRLLAATIHADEDVEPRDNLANALVIRARYHARHGLDVSHDLARASELADYISQREPLQACDLRARIAIVANQPAVGLDCIGKLVARRPTNATWWVVKARLEILAGDRAAATVSLGWALALNGRVRTTADYREAAAMLSRPASPP